MTGTAFETLREACDGDRIKAVLKKLEVTVLRIVAAQQGGNRRYVLTTSCERVSRSVCSYFS